MQTHCGCAQASHEYSGLCVRRLRSGTLFLPSYEVCTGQTQRRANVSWL